VAFCVVLIFSSFGLAFKVLMNMLLVDIDLVYLLEYVVMFGWLLKILYRAWLGRRMFWLSWR